MKLEKRCCLIIAPVFFTLLILLGNRTSLAQWPQATGPAGDFVIEDQEAPDKWSVILDQNIAWRKSLGARTKLSDCIRRPTVLYD